MSLVFDLDSTRLSLALARLRNFTRQTVAEFMTEQFRLLLGQIIKFTPPKNLAQGRKRVVRDILKVFRPFDYSKTKNERLREIIKSGDQRAFEAFARAIRQPWLASTFSKAAHEAARDARGGTRGTGRNVPFVLGTGPQRELRQHVVHKQANVGIARSGWSAALLLVGGEVPAWVLRHGSNFGGVIDHRARFENPELIAINRTPWASDRGEGDRIIADAMRARTAHLATALRVQIRLAAARSGFGAAA